jgi:hypothetical protein
MRSDACPTAMITRISRTISAVLAIVVVVAGIGIGAFMLYTRGGPSGVLARDLPSSGEPELGVDYRADVDCLSRIYIGEASWQIKIAQGRWPPPELMPGLRAAISPASVPGIVRFTSPTSAVFRAQTDGSEWEVTRGVEAMEGARCL